VINIAGVPASQIVIFRQSVGTAAAVAVSHYFASQSPPIVFAGTVLVALFVNVLTWSLPTMLQELFPSYCLFAGFLRYLIIFSALSRINS
jgi:abhydrolase domain-containing protein 12